MSNEHQLPREMETVAVSEYEGAEWVGWGHSQARRIRTVHAIQFANGVIWDAVNGFRGLEGKNMRLVVRVPMGRKEIAA